MFFHYILLLNLKYVQIVRHCSTSLFLRKTKQDATFAFALLHLVRLRYLVCRFDQTVLSVFTLVYDIRIIRFRIRKNEEIMA